MPNPRCALIAGALFIAASAASAVAAPGQCPDRLLWALKPGSTATFDGLHVDHRRHLIDDGQIYLPGEVVAALPDRARIVALDVGAAGQLWFAIDTTVTLAGVTYRPNDVVAHAGGAFSKAFDGSAHGVPPGVRIAALDHRAGLRLAFDRSFTHQGLLIRPIDVVRVEPGGTLVREFDGAGAGLTTAARVAAIALAAPDDWRIAFAGTGQMAGLALTGSRVFAYRPGTGAVSLDYDLLSRSPHWTRTRLAALAVMSHPDHLFCSGFQAP